MSGKHTEPTQLPDTRLGSEVQPFWLAPRPPQPGDLLRPLTLPPDDMHGYIDLARRTVKVAGYTSATVGLLLVGFIVRGFVG